MSEDEMARILTEIAQDERNPALVRVRAIGLLREIAEACPPGETEEGDSPLATLMALRPERYPRKGTERG